MNRSTIAGLLLAACTPNPNQIEEISHEPAAQEAVPAVDVSAPEVAALPPAPALTAMLPKVMTPAPQGIDAALWRDIGWFPADTVELAGSAGRDNTPLLRWAEDSIAREFPACGPLVAAIDRIYMVQQGTSREATQVVFGSLTREQERGCLQALLPGMGLTAVQQETMTIVSRKDEVIARAGWWKDDEGAVVVIEGEAPLEGWREPGGPPNQELLAPLTAVDRTLGMWMASSRDYGSFFTGVASSGLTLATTRPAPGASPVFSVKIGVRFASAREAKAAERGAAKFVASAPASDGNGLRLSVRAEGSWLRVELVADLSEGGAQTFMAWAEKMTADMRAAPPT